MARPFLSRNSGPVFDPTLCKEMIPCVESKPALMGSELFPHVPSRRAEISTCLPTSYRDAQGPAQHSLGDVEEAGLGFLAKGSQKVLAVPDNAPRGDSQPSTAFRNLMMEFRITFFTQRVVELRNRPSERCPKPSPREMSGCGQGKP